MRCSGTAEARRPEPAANRVDGRVEALRLATQQLSAAGQQDARIELVAGAGVGWAARQRAELVSGSRCARSRTMRAATCTVTACPDPHSRVATSIPRSGDAR